MFVVQSPNNPPHYPLPAVYLAGGIAGCPDWQADMIRLLANLDDGTLLNPRRPEWPESGPLLEQNKWEVSFLWRSQVVPFWFPKEAVCPMALFELGTQLVRARVSTKSQVKVCIGIEPGYRRHADVEAQVALLAPNLPIYRSLDDIAAFVAKEVKALAQ